MRNLTYPISRDYCGALHHYVWFINFKVVLIVVYPKSEGSFGGGFVIFIEGDLSLAVRIYG